MRELTVRLRLTRPCLGNVKDRRFSDGRLVFLRNPDDSIIFLATWHQPGMRLAAQLFGRHQTEVDKILWDVNVGVVLRADPWFKRYYGAAKDGRRRFAIHEAIFAGQLLDLNCCVPSAISDDAFVSLMNIAGRYHGLSPWRQNEFGRFVVDGITVRRGLAENEKVEATVFKNQ